jgi:tyrosine-specific transport protein
MKKPNHFLGAVLLISGTTIGAGMLAVPVTMGFMGFIPSILLFMISWALMLITGFFFVDVNCAYKEDTNLISMAGKTLGVLGKAVCWTFYLLLLYALVAAYISGSAPLFIAGAKALFGITLSANMAYYCLPLIFGSFLYFGIQGIDLVNRVLMIGLLVSYLLIVCYVPSHIDFALLKHCDMKLGVIAVPVVMTSFGYHIIIPSLGTYMKHDKKQLKKAILVGSLLTLVVYMIWQFLVLGVVPVTGAISLGMAWRSGDSVAPLSELLKNPLIAKGVTFFAFFAIVTSFLGVALSLSDFLTDGFKIKKTWEGRLTAYLLTFVPPIFFVLHFQRGFITALEYAGAFVAILLGILPACMVLKVKKLTFYQSTRGKCLAYFVMLLCSLVVIDTFLNEFGFFGDLIKPYFP